MSEDIQFKKLRAFIGKKKPLLFKLESICAVIVALGIITHFKMSDVGNYFCLPGLIALALIYYFLAFNPVIIGNENNEEIILTGIEKFQYEIYFWSLTMSCVAMIFYIFRIQYWDFLVKSSVATLFVTIALSFIQYLRHKTLMMDFTYTIRIIIAIGVQTILLFEKEILFRIDSVFK